MTGRESRHIALLDRMADHLLAEGLKGASLRPLAAAAGTSDRMLLYYFASKDELLGAVFAHVAGRMTGLLERTDEVTAQPYAGLLGDIATAVRAPAFQPYMHLWLDLAAAASRGREPHRNVARGIADGFLAWVSDRLVVEREADRAGQAALLLATVDGLALLDAVDRGAAVERALASLKT